MSPLWGANILKGIAVKRVVILLVLLAQNTFAEDVISLKHNVVFDHQSHNYEKVGKCVVCHEQKPGKIAGILCKAWAHKNCIGCHDLYQQGPRR